MRTIRYNTFETNSSSTHSLLILTEEECDKIEKGEMFLLSQYDREVITKEERDKVILDEMYTVNKTYDYMFQSIEEFMESDYYFDNRSEFPCNIDEWCDSDYLEIDSYDYTSPAGDKIKIIAKYGNDY